jgi:hypothetical protein
MSLAARDCPHGFADDIQLDINTWLYQPGKLMLWPPIVVVAPRSWG